MITPITATFPALNFPKEVDYPTQEDWAAFSAAAELNYGILSGTWSDKSEEFKAQTNNLALEIQEIGENAFNAISLDTIEDLATYTGTGLVMVKDLNRGGNFVSKTVIEIDPNIGILYDANGGTVFAKLGGGFWVRQYSGAVNVKWFGAKGDGITDDTAAIQNTIDRMSNYIWNMDKVTTRANSVASNIFMPKGIYRITNSIYLAPDCTVSGEIQSESPRTNIDIGTKIKADFGTNRLKYILELRAYKDDGTRYTSSIGEWVDGVSTSNEDRLNGVHIKNIQLDGGGDALSERVFGGIRVIVAPYSTFENISINNVEHGMFVNSSWNLKLDTVAFKYFNIGMMAYKQVNDALLTNCSFSAEDASKTWGNQYTSSDMIWLNIMDNIVVLPYINRTTCLWVNQILKSTLINCTLEQSALGIVENRSNINVIGCWYEQLDDCCNIASGGALNFYGSRREGSTPFIRSSLSIGHHSIVGLTGTQDEGSAIDTSTLLDDGYGINVSYDRALVVGVDDSLVTNNLYVTDSKIQMKNLHTFTSSGAVAKTIGMTIANTTTDFVRINANDERTSGISAYEGSLSLQTMANGTIRDMINITSRGAVLPRYSSTSQSLGNATYRFSEVFAVNGTINTSDDREKTYLDIEEVELLVAKELKNLVKKFKFNDAIVSKGIENARIHYGTSAQEVIAVFEKHGLDAMQYSMVCYDEWDEAPEVRDEEDSITQAYVPAGNRYGIRYEELLCFIISAM